MEEVAEDGPPTIALSPCGHVFHSECAVAWFRSPNSAGTCPECRGQPDLDLVRDYTLAERVTLVRAAARRKAAPKRLKAMVQRLRAAESDQREASRAERAARREEAVKSVQQRLRALRRKKWAAYDKVRKHRRLVGLYNDPEGLIAHPRVLLSESRGFGWRRRV